MKLHFPKLALSATKVPSVYGVHTVVTGSLRIFGFVIKLHGSRIMMERV